MLRQQYSGYDQCMPQFRSHDVIMPLEALVKIGSTALGLPQYVCVGQAGKAPLCSGLVAVSAPAGVLILRVEARSRQLCKQPGKAALDISLAVVLQIREFDCKQLSKRAVDELSGQWVIISMLPIVTE